MLYYILTKGSSKGIELIETLIRIRQIKKFKSWWCERFGVVDGQGLDVDEVAVSSKGSSSSSLPQRFVSIFGTGNSYGSGGEAAATVVVFSWGSGGSRVNGVSHYVCVCERERESEWEWSIKNKFLRRRVYIFNKKKKIRFINK